VVEPQGGREPARAAPAAGALRARLRSAAWCWSPLGRIGRRALSGAARLGPLEALRRLGRDPRGTLRALGRQEPDPAWLDEAYQAWLERHRLTPDGVKAIDGEIAALAYRPTISVLMPVFDPPEAWLRAAIDSVRQQLYPGWELCLVDDGSAARHVAAVLEESARADGRVRVHRLERNEGICGASNHALALATGEFVAPADHDDVLAPDALLEVARCLDRDPGLDFLYTDRDVIQADGRRVRPFFKPGWSPDLLLSMNYVAHLTVFRRELVERVGGFRTGFEGAQDYDLVLRVTEATDRIRHIPRPLYSWGQAPGSVALRPGAKPYAHEAGRRALEEALARRHVPGEVLDGLGAPYRYRVRRRIAGQPLVSILIPTRDNARLLRRCLDSLARRTAYRHLEILVIDNGSRDPRTVAYLGRLPHRIVPFPQPFNFARMNNLAATQARGEHLLFLNDDTEAIEPGWLEALLEHSERPEVGAVGARLLFPDGTIQHAGIVVGIQGKAGHAFAGLPGNHPGYFDLARAIRNTSAVTAACLMTRRAVFEEVGGFDEAFEVAYNDVDLCLRLRERGYLVVYTPYAVLRHHQSASRGPYDPVRDARAERLLRERWRHVFERGDPYYNPNLTLERADFSLRR
jgi:GT2 family glycosyltransferase